MQQELARELRDRRLDLRSRIADGLSRWLEPREAGRLAAYLLAVQQGMAIQARDGADERELLSIRDEVMAGIRARPASPSAQVR